MVVYRLVINPLLIMLDNQPRGLTLGPAPRKVCVITDDVTIILADTTHIPKVINIIKT